MFIVFEGVDGSGKDTQLNKVFEYLGERNKNLQIWKTKEPTNYTVSGKLILEKLQSGGFNSPEEALELYVADREEQTSLRREILKHSAILSSRFDYTTYAYQGISGISFDKIKSAHNYDNIIIPDITFIFDVNSDNIKKRLNNRGGKKEFFENIEFLQKANKEYLKIAEKLKNERTIFVIDANESIEKTFDKVKSILDLYEF